MLGVQPWSLRSPAVLARRVLEAQGFAVPQNLAFSWLREEFRVPEKETLSSWTATFSPPDSRPSDLLSAYIGQRLAHRNRWRPGLAFHSMRLLSIPVHPFADRRVMDAYLALPIASLRRQATHIAAAMSGPTPLGTVPSNQSPLSLRNELRPSSSHGTDSVAHRQWLRLKKARRGRSIGGLTLSTRGSRCHSHNIKSHLFDSDTCRAASRTHRVDPTTITKLAATAIHAAFAMDRSLPLLPTSLVSLILETAGGKADKPTDRTVAAPAAHHTSLPPYSVSVSSTSTARSLARPSH